VAGRDVAVNYNNSGVDSVLFAQYVKELGATEQVVNSFFGTLLKQKVPRDQWDSKLREIATTHKELLVRLATVQSEDPEVVRLKQEAGQAIEAGDYAKAEKLLNQAEARDLKAIEELKQAARQRRISVAATNAEQAELQRVQLRYEKAAQYWQKAAALLPEGEKKDRGLYLSKAGYDLHRIAEYQKALPLFEQSLAISQEIGDRAGEGTTLNNISQIYDARGNYDTALKYLEQSLAISREIGDRAGEGTTLNNISQIYDARGDYDTALKYLEQSLAIRQEVGDRAGEAVTSWNIGHIYKKQGDLAKAERYMARTVEIDEAIGHPDLENDRKALAKLRAEIRGK